MFDDGLVTLIHEKSKLTPTGLALLQDDLAFANICMSRLELHHDPVVIEKPIFITGTGRTASSFLHAQMRDAGFRVATVAQATMMQNNPSDMALSYVQNWIEKGDCESPEYSMINPHQWYDPAEDIHFDRAIFGTPWWLSHYGGIMDWAIERMYRDPFADMVHVRRCAEVLSMPGDRWCFRATTYLMRLETIFEVFPDATVIWLERDIAHVEPSLFKMIRAMRLTRSQEVDEEEVAMLANSMATIGPMIAQKTIDDGKVDPDKIIRVSFEDLTENTEATVQALVMRLGAMKVKW